MKRQFAYLLAGVGTLLVLVGAGFGLLTSSPAPRAPLWVGVPGGLLVVALALWKLARSPSGDGVAPAPWSEGGAIVDQPPESTPKSDPISGTELADVIEAAATDAREDTVEAGLATVRTPLREALVEGLGRGGWDRDRIETALAEGSWTDDPVAASVLDENVRPPERSLRRRLWAWLFPGKAIRHRTALAVGAVTRATEGTLPPVVGQHAPRPMPVVEPTVEDLQRAADGSLRRAVEGSAAVGAPEHDTDIPDEERDETEPAAAGGTAGEDVSPPEDGTPDDTEASVGWPSGGGR